MIRLIWQPNSSLKRKAYLFDTFIVVLAILYQFFFGSYSTFLYCPIPTISLKISILQPEGKMHRIGLKETWAGGKTFINEIKIITINERKAINTFATTPNISLSPLWYLRMPHRLFRQFFFSITPFYCDIPFTSCLEKYLRLSHSLYALCSSIHHYMFLVHVQLLYVMKKNSSFMQSHCCQHLMKLYKWRKEYYAAYHVALISSHSKQHQKVILS